MSLGARVVFVLVCAPAGAVAFGASWVLIGLLYDALAVAWVVATLALVAWLAS